MPVISSTKVHLKEYGEWTKVVKYSKGLFTILLPDIVLFDLCIAADSPGKELSAKTEQEVNRLYDEKIKEWETRQTKTEPVILFIAKFQGGLIREEFQEKWNGGKYKPAYDRGGYAYDETNHYFIARDIDPFNVSLGLTIQWAVYEKTTFKGKSRYKYSSGRHFDSSRLNNCGTDGMTEIQWSPVREQFFLELDERFAKMIANVYSALGDLTPEKLVALAEGGQKLLG